MLTETSLDCPQGAHPRQIKADIKIPTRTFGIL